MESFERVLIILSCTFIILLAYVWRYVAPSKSKECIIKKDKEIDDLYKKFRKILSKKGYCFIKHIPPILKITTKYLMAYNKNNEICVCAIVFDEKKVNFSDICFLFEQISQENDVIFVEKIIYINNNKNDIDLEIIKEVNENNVEIWDKKGNVVN